MELRRYWAILIRWWWLLLLGPIITGLVAYFIGSSLTPTYEAKAMVLVAQRQSSAAPSYSDILASERLAKTYSELITTSLVLEEVGGSFEPPLGADELKGMVSVDPIRDTQLLEIKVNHSSPTFARDLVNKTAEVFISRNRDNQLEEISRLQSALIARGITNVESLVSAQVAAVGSVSLAEPATVPESPVRPRVVLNTLLAAIAGLTIAIGIVMVWDYLDDTIKSSRQVEEKSLVPLAQVARFRGSDNSPSTLVNANTRTAAAAEAYRVLRTNIQFSSMDQKIRTVLVTSPGPQEGKSTTLSNLAVAMAQAGRHVAVVDTDLRRPSLHRVFGFPNEQGLTNFLISEDSDIFPYLKATEIENLTVLTAGVLPPNPAELLGSSRMRVALEALSQSMDTILLDSPPLLAVADASILSSLADGVILVVELGRTREGSVERAQDVLTQANAHIMGCVLNKASGGAGSGYYYYYYSSDHRDGRSRWPTPPWRKKAKRRSSHTASQ